MLHVTRQLLSCLGCIGMIILVFFVGRGHVSGEFTGKGMGFGGEVSARVLIHEGRLAYIEGEGALESAAIGRAAMPLLAERMLQKQSPEVDVVSGATYTSAGMIEAVKDALAKAGVSSGQFSGEEQSEAVAALEEPLEFTADIAVAGGGGAGMIAAIRGAEAGKRVIILERNPLLGGNTARAGLGLAAAGTHYQKKRLIEDSAGLFEKDILAAAEELGNPALASALASDSAALVDWLDSQNILLSGEVEEMGGHSVPRLHHPGNEEENALNVGDALAAGLMNRIGELGIPVLTQTTVLGVLTEEGRAAGVRALSREGREILVRADAVIIATGGFGASPSRIGSYRPELRRISPVGASGNDGSAVEFLQALGADFTDMDKLQVYPAFALDGTMVPEELFTAGAVLLNQAGNRFTEETGEPEVVTGELLLQEGSRAILLANQEMLDAFPELSGLKQRGLMFSASRLRELGDKLGFSENARKNLEQAAPGQGPYHAFYVTPGVMMCPGGVRIDEKARVLNMDGAPIPGLYAAGEVTGGVHGAACLPGDSLTDAGVFGLRAADSAIRGE